MIMGTDKQTKMRIPTGKVKRSLLLIEWQNELSLRRAKDHRDPLSLPF